MADAMWALIGVAVGAGITGVVNWIQQSRQFAHDREMFTLKNTSADMVKAILVEMLNHRRYVERSFDALKKSVSGYSDEAIRQFLHEVGARRVEREDGRSLTWGDTLRRLGWAFVSLLPAGLGFAWVLVDPERRAWHDRLSRTRVVVLPKR